MAKRASFRCTFCGGLLNHSRDEHFKGERHRAAVREWDECHSPVLREQMHHHFYHLLLKIPCRCERKRVAA